ncbi:hypothetical protein [Aerococcus urinaeequi]|uniref:Uncharacterized protein n=1 Tax=Aerococcus urinaeequi TaxID=51665 RepID=A0AAC8X034_9LACT|nr:hypothetical protein [Aerococcus urinaeequi]AMB97391.1 hypothetical protein AWM74_03645 [Aerococcus urinaeequi]
MINWDNVRYNPGIAKEDFTKLSLGNNFYVATNISEDFLELREKLIEARDVIYDRHELDYADKLDYKFDLLYGLKIYEILNEKIGFTNRVATDDNIWRFLSIRLIPDVVHARWGLNEDRYFKSHRRIWLKTIWWYIHLSWTGDVKSTYELLKSNTTDTIAQLLERPGIGYNIDLYREIMLQYSTHNDSTRNMFRRVLKLNIAKLPTITPELVDGGIQHYVSDLYRLVTLNDNQ